MQSLNRSVAILRALAADGEHRQRLSEVARAVRLSKATTARILAALCELGLVDEADETPTYGLGLELALLGWSAARNVSLTQLARPALEGLAAATGDTAYLTVRSDLESVCADRVVGGYPVKALTIEIGNRRPLGVGAGSLAILAALPDAEVNRILALNVGRLSERYPSFTHKRIRAYVTETRRRGYALSENRLLANVSAVARAVRDPRGNPIAAISVAAIESRFAGGRVKQVTAATRAAAEEVERALVNPNVAGAAPSTP